MVGLTTFGLKARPFMLGARGGRFGKRGLDFEIELKRRAKKKEMAGVVRGVRSALHARLQLHVHLPRDGRRFISTAVYSPATFLDKNAISDRVLAFLRSSEKVDLSKVTADADFQKDLELDHLDKLEIATTLEEEFAIDIPDKEVQKWSSFANVIDFVASHPQAK